MQVTQGEASFALFFSLPCLFLFCLPLTSSLNQLFTYSFHLRVSRCSRSYLSRDYFSLTWTEWGIEQIKREIKSERHCQWRHSLLAFVVLSTCRFNEWPGVLFQSLFLATHIVNRAPPSYSCHLSCPLIIFSFSELQLNLGADGVLFSFHSFGVLCFLILSSMAQACVMSLGPFSLFRGP